jgi:hypothetical protein
MIAGIKIHSAIVIPKANIRGKVLVNVHLFWCLSNSLKETLGIGIEPNSQHFMPIELSNLKNTTTGCWKPGLALLWYRKPVTTPLTPVASPACVHKFLLSITLHPTAS